MSLILYISMRETAKWLSTIKNVIRLHRPHFIQYLKIALFGFAPWWSDAIHTRIGNQLTEVFIGMTK